MTSKKLQNNILSPEDISADTYYTLSINPCDDFQYWMSDKRIEQSVSWMQHLVDSIDATVVLQMEISRLGRLHYHGTIVWGLAPDGAVSGDKPPSPAPASPQDKNILMFFNLSLHNLLSKATIEIDHIDDLTEWNEYCQKGKRFNLPTISTTDAKKKRIRKLLNNNTIQFKTIDSF